MNLINLLEQMRFRLQKAEEDLALFSQFGSRVVVQSSGNELVLEDHLRDIVQRHELLINGLQNRIEENL